MAESGDFPIKLIRSNEPRFGKPLVKNVELGTSLPRIVRLQEQVRQLRSELQDPTPMITMTIQNGTIDIDGKLVPLSPVEVAYYRYFLERAKSGNAFVRISGIQMPATFSQKIVDYHRASFPETDLYSKGLERLLERGNGISVSTFRTTVSRINKRLKAEIGNAPTQNLITIQRNGLRYRTSYGVLIPPDRIIIER